MDMEERLGRVEERLEAMQDDTTAIRRAVVGNGNPGLIIRVDRLEQTESRRKWLVRTLILTSLGATTGVIFLLVRILIMG